MSDHTPRSLPQTPPPSKGYGKPGQAQYPTPFTPTPHHLVKSGGRTPQEWSSSDFDRPRPATPTPTKSTRVTSAGSRTGSHKRCFEEVNYIEYVDSSSDEEPKPVQPVGERVSNGKRAKLGIQTEDRMGGRGDEQGEYQPEDDESNVEDGDVKPSSGNGLAKSASCSRGGGGRGRGRGRGRPRGVVSEGAGGNRNGRKVGAWTKEETRALWETTALIPTKISWDGVAAQVPGRDKLSCSNKWRYDLLPKIQAFIDSQGD